MSPATRFHCPSLRLSFKARILLQCLRANKELKRSRLKDCEWNSQTAWRPSDGSSCCGRKDSPVWMEESGGQAEPSLGGSKGVPNPRKYWLSQQYYIYVFKGNLISLQNNIICHIKLTLLIWILWTFLFLCLICYFVLVLLLNQS